ncbi:DNA-binding global transcriptional regulator BolA, affects cell shape, cell division and biofilm formation [Rhodanobacter sp. Root179]|uniref:BolA family protein n=1 Tax=unclassified Rhodanobacter TaxID=2621553 RepID=UPI0006FB8028|nr:MULTISPECIES: BolA family protein [unclassified Rhodanobacter]KQZ77642.1 cell division protein BolA [Rhodanobacter sp. Root561]KRB34772.1 cell division protein BolA [Rhodanobacter sp. Root179]
MSEVVLEQIRQRLTAALAPTELEVVDEGHLHAGHAGEGKGHFHVRIVSPAFAGLLPIRRHRMVYAALDGLMDNGIHALSIDAKNK